MKKATILTSLFAGTMISLASNALANVVVIVNPANSNAVDNDSVKRIFLGKEKKFPGGESATPINQKGDAASRNQFDEQVLERNSSQISAYWSKLVFTGKGTPPKEVTDDAAAIAAVAADPSAISYVSAGSVTDAVKVIPVN
ncbi:phosphate ABC transporter substrate-binding protein [Alteromonas ponticola]|uniref:Phosphate ABC transporter substrate-binding protein n=1 Tax=Alteromonas ponticola TaxID=2720613 RepID=A0ABX1R7V6_9ALTE|nr:phosphate ABC transporter substrate-binding protein [Alteromonas ponticola]NMH61207.1 phosphate ABC transporter substrate-binding protein [Alteromonas ponticola]